MDIRDRIQQQMDAMGLTPRGLSLNAGLSDSMMHKFMTGATRSMTVENLEKVADALGVTAQWLIFGDAPRLPAEVINIWDRILERDKARAVRILETFAGAAPEGTEKKM